MSIGVVFDSNGVARLPATGGTPAPETPVAAPTPAPTAAKPPATPPQKLPTQAQFDAKWATMQPGETTMGPDGKPYTKQEKK